MDESLFTHNVNRELIWIIGIIDNQTKDFRLIASKERDNDTLKAFISKITPNGNFIITDGWDGYDW